MAILLPTQAVVETPPNSVQIISFTVNLPNNTLTISYQTGDLDGLIFTPRGDTQVVTFVGQSFITMVGTYQDTYAAMKIALYETLTAALAG